jgi:alanyl-tRNA synthetase
LARDLEIAIENARSVPESELGQVIGALQKNLGAERVPLRAKRRGQAAVAELQAMLNAWEKSQKQSTAVGFDFAAILYPLLADATPLGPDAQAAQGKLIIAEIPGASDDQLRAAMDSLKKKLPSHAILLASSADGKVSFVAAVSDDLIAKGLKAGDWVREAAKAAGGGGGGRPQMAQAGGKDPFKLPQALQVAREFANAKVL